MFSLYLYQRLSEGTGYDMDLTRWARNTWRRSTRAVGGYWTGDLVIVGVSELMFQQLYSTMIGKRVRETSYSMTTWEGEIVGLSLTLNGITQEQSLDTELWHNKVKTQYTYPRADDVEQGALAYVAPAGNDGLQDATQDFSEWETLAGDAVFDITVINDDDTRAYGFCGAAFNTGGANDSIYVYIDVELGTRGWNGEAAGKTPLTYEVSNILNAGAERETAWSETTASSDIYGESQYIEVMSEQCYAATAEAARDRRLTQNAYPRSLPVGALQAGAGPQGNRLDVTCAGYAASMNRRFYEANAGNAAINDQVAALIAASEWIGEGTLSTNALESVMAGEDIPFRLWDEIEELIDMGPGRYVGGVYQDQAFTYAAGATGWLYRWANNRLYYITGQLVPPTMITPNIVVRTQPPLALIPPGGTSWSSILTAWITEVEFVAPHSYRLTSSNGDLLGGY